MMHAVDGGKQRRIDRRPGTRDNPPCPDRPQSQRHQGNLEDLAEQAAHPLGQGLAVLMQQ